MSKAPRVERFDTHAVIHPPQTLRQKARFALGEPDESDKAVIRAEQALARIAKDFPEMMAAEIDALHAARLALADNLGCREHLSRLHRAAHNIKGDAPTLGFPFAARLARGLCRLVEANPPDHPVPIAAINRHVDAIRAVVREGARGSEHPTAEKLTMLLERQVVDMVGEAED